MKDYTILLKAVTLKFIIYFQTVFCLSIIDLYCCVAFKMDSKVIHLHIYIYLFCYMYIYVREC